MKRRLAGAILVLTSIGLGTWLYRALLVPAKGPGDGGPNFEALFYFAAAGILMIAFGVSGLTFLCRR